MARLKDLRYVDDARYAAAFVATTAARRAWGPARIRAELSKRGIARETAEAALRDAEETREAGQETALDRAVGRAIRRLGTPCDRHDRDKFRAALRRQGFGAAEVSAAMRRLAAARRPEPGESE